LAILALAAGAGRPPTDWRSVAALGANDFEDVVLAKHPAVRRVHGALAATDAELVLLSGSGATVFALYRHPEAVRVALGGIPPLEGATFLPTRTRTGVPEPREASPRPGAGNPARG
jgi:4-diphosphocytidyl-2C-methyl-D-erythritol kinase